MLEPPYTHMAPYGTPAAMTLGIAADAAPLYEYSSQMLGWTIDEDRISSMRKANEEQLSKLEASIRDAEENLGDIEVRDAFLAKADYLYKIGTCKELSKNCQKPFFQGCQKWSVVVLLLYQTMVVT